MRNGTAPRDLEWLRRILREHFRRAWRRVFAKLDVTPAEVRRSNTRPRTIER